VLESEIKAEPGEHFITEVVTTEAAQDEMAGLAEGLKQQQEHHEIRPEAMYADAVGPRGPSVRHLIIYLTCSSFTPKDNFEKYYAEKTRPEKGEGACFLILRNFQTRELGSGLTISQEGAGLQEGAKASGSNLYF
jgi:hypothetical protein